MSKDRVAAVLAMRAKGMSIDKIRRELRMGAAAVRAIVNDPVEASRRADEGLSITGVGKIEGGQHIPAPPLPADRASIDLEARVARVLTSGERISPPRVNPYHVASTGSPAGQCADVGGGDHRGSRG